VAILIVSVLSSRTLKKVKVLEKDNTVSCKRKTDTKMLEYNTYAIIFYECFHLGSARRHDDDDDDDSVYCKQ
jgi:hypothetical protein